MDFAMVPRTPPPPRDSTAYRFALDRLLDRAAMGLLICDADLRVIATCGKLDKKLAVSELIPELERAVTERLREPLGENRVPLASGRVLQLVAVERVPGPFVLVWLREEALSDERVAGPLREQYGIGLRGQQLVALLWEGLSNREIAERLRLREATVKTYLYDVYRALGVRSRTGVLALVKRLAESRDLR